MSKNLTIPGNAIIKGELIIGSSLEYNLKVDKFKHEHLSQLNSYVSFYNDQVKQKDDSKTIGILLCTEKGEKMVEYALAGMEEKLFVSKYLIALPSKEVLSDFIQKEIKNL